MLATREISSPVSDLNPQSPLYLARVALTSPLVLLDTRTGLIGVLGIEWMAYMRVSNSALFASVTVAYTVFLCHPLRVSRAHHFSFHRRGEDIVSHGSPPAASTANWEKRKASRRAA